MIKVEVVFEKENFIVLDKPRGLVVHPFDFSSEFTLLDFLNEKHPHIFEIKNEKKLQDGRVIKLGGIVHKLDRDTSGIIVVAKNQKTFDVLRNLFTERKVKKTYLAVVEGEIQEKEFVINAPLGRAKKSFRQEVNPENPRGELREAITNVKVLKISDGKSFVELNPVTGRTHQLRVHMAHIGHPIVGDKIYGNYKEGENLMLHAQKIEFELEGEKYFFETEELSEFL